MFSRWCSTATGRVLALVHCLRRADMCAHTNMLLLLLPLPLLLLQVAVLFRNHNDLLTQFTYFLPDNSPPQVWQQVLSSSSSSGGGVIVSVSGADVAFCSSYAAPATPSMPAAAAVAASSRFSPMHELLNAVGTLRLV